MGGAAHRRIFFLDALETELCSLFETLQLARADVTGLLDRRTPTRRVDEPLSRCIEFLRGLAIAFALVLGICRSLCGR